MIRAALSSAGRASLRTKSSPNIFSVPCLRSSSSGAKARDVTRTARRGLSQQARTNATPQQQRRGSSLLSNASTASRESSRWTAPSVRSLNATASFHSSARHLDRRPTYTRFGGSKSSGGVFENLYARFSDPGTRTAIFVVLGLGGGYYVYHLERVPESGRWRFIDVSREAERAAGLESFESIIRQYGDKVVPANHPVSKYVQQVAERIISSARLGHVKGYGQPAAADPFASIFAGDDIFDPDPTKFGGSTTGSIAENDEWEVFVINEDSTRNAFVLPGGKIFVFTGILPVAKTQDGLASVLGHEIAHAVARHSGERMSSTKILFALVILLELIGLDFGTGLNRLGLSLFLTLPNSRTQEAEADAIGLTLMSKACFDPREASQMWVRMEKAEKGNDEDGGSGIMAWFRALLGGGSVGNIDFLSTHPASGKRIKAMEERLPEALAVRAASPGCGRDLEGQYDAFKRSVW